MFLFYLFYCWTNINISKDINVNADILPTLTFAIAKTAVAYFLENCTYFSEHFFQFAAKVLGRRQAVPVSDAAASGHLCSWKNAFDIYQSKITLAQ